MAGVVAMASVIEDFDTQPCKKSRKDGGSHIVKTITNYFSPVPKPAEKPFSPPRSTNITDYFSRKMPSSKEKPGSLEQSKENCQTSPLEEKHTSPEAAVKPPTQKRRRKASKAARKLVEAETFSLTDEASCLVVEEQHASRDSAAEAVSSCGVLGSDTAALMARLSAEACITEEKSAGDATKTVCIEEAEEDGSKCGNEVSSDLELNSIELSPIILSKNKAKPVKTPHCRKAKNSEPEEKERSLCDASMEVNVDEASQLNNSTVTISFEEFVRSQSQSRDEEDLEDEGQIRTKTEEVNTDQMVVPKAGGNDGSEESPVQVSPRTVTIQAEVHAISPKQETSKAGGKLASIFNRRKVAMSPAEVTTSSPRVEVDHQHPCTSLAVKRKSNVVLQEEDLELAVLESESMPKCSEAERKQFMAAFKQPKRGKSQTKQKQPGEKALDDAEEDAVIQPSVEQVPDASLENTVTKKKPARRGRKKAKEDKEEVKAPPETDAAAAAAEEPVATVVEVDDQSEEPLITSTPCVPVVRRSRREAVVRQAPPATPKSPIRKTRRQNKSKEDAASPAEDVPAETPKTRKSKRSIFRAEMVCPPDTKGSPIRIKFTRVHKNVSTSKAESRSTKTSNDSEKRMQAKKLVEKAKVIQQSKKNAVKEKVSLRRSARSETSAKKSYCEDEDSIICLEEDDAATPHTAPEKSKTQKPLRSLHEVLGKPSSVGKETKITPGSKGASLGQEKSARKVSAVISIFDDSSSETSQDDEQFKARREFLKSGLPDSFRKQMARTAATKEAYSLSCSSFQPVTHVTQQSNDCSLWSLLWPESSSLCHLKNLWCQTSNLPPSVTGSLSVRTQPARRAHPQRGSGWRPEISESVRQLLLEEVSTSNPSFPAQMFITRFLKRHADHQQQSTEPEAVTSITSATLPAEPVAGKRKRLDDEGEMTAKAKKQRAEGNTAEPEPTKRESRMRRARRSRPEEEQPKVQTPPKPSEDDSVVVIDDSPSGENTDNKDVAKEDMLWTDKYQPQHSSDIIGNAASVRRLHSWLKEWKLRADREERKKQKDKKHEEGSNDSDWDCGEEDSQDGEDTLCNTMLITGPTGVGKTAAVYACAQELGFKVFEVNASSQRSGRLILSQLKEATQSHQVDSQGVNANKPAYFNSYGTSSSAPKAGYSPRKVNSPRRVVSSPRKHPQSPRGAKKGSLAPTSLANFFKMGRPTNKETANTKQTEQTATSKMVSKANTNKLKDPAVRPPAASTPKVKSNEEQSKKTATSLILFEEVDVIFDDDSGFLAAIKTFMTTTKRPVILTTSDPAFSTMFDGNFEEILFKTPSVLDVGSFLQLLCLSEDTRTDLLDVGSLLRLNGCDIRQSLLQLQFWTRSAGGCHEAVRPVMHTGKNAELKPGTALPPCDTGCTQSMLGLLNVEPEGDIWELLKQKQCPVEEPTCWRLLTNSQRRGVDLLYSNMETLLPLPLTQLTTSTHKTIQPVSAPQDLPSVTTKEPPPHARLLHTAESADFSDDGSPIKMSNRMKRNKKQHSLPDRCGLHSDSDSEDSFVSLCKPQGAAQDRQDVTESLVSEPVKRKRKTLTPEERLKAPAVSQCLASIADFLDDMSYMDSLLLRPEAAGGLRRPVSAVVKDGMTDEARVETDRGSWMRGEHVLEIPAAVEALSFRRCRASVAEAWDKVTKLDGDVGKEAAAELSLPVAAHREGYTFTQDGPCQPQLVQRRRDVMESVMFRASGTLGNRAAASMDYLPALRTICRSEQLKEQGKVKRRFLHYLDATHLGLEKITLQHLAEDFP